MMWKDSSGDGATRTSPSKINSTLCGKDFSWRRLWAELTTIRLCTETPTAGGRIFETGDENLLRLAHDTGSALVATISAIPLMCGGLVFMESAPVIIVFTKYDALVRTKRYELEDDDDSLSEDALHQRSKEEARKILDQCIQFLEHILGDTNTPKPHHVNVSSIYFPLVI
jgi:hypothetical protein